MNEFELYSLNRVVNKYSSKELSDIMNESTIYMLNNLTRENMALRRDGTILKLVMRQIVEDLEKTKDNEKYIEWIKENCNLDLYSEQDTDELEEINRKRTYKYISTKRMLQNEFSNASNSIEANTIYRIAKKLRIDIFS